MTTCIPLNDYVKDKAKQFNTDAETIQDALYTYYNELGQSDDHYPSDQYLKSYVDYQVVYEDGAEQAEEFRKKFYAEPRIYGDEDELAYAIHTAKKYFNADQIKIETLADDRKMLSIVEATSDKSSAVTKGLQEQRELTLTIDGKSITIPYIYCKEETDQIIRDTAQNVVFKPNRKTSDLFKKAQKKYPELFKILEQDGITVEYLSNTIDSYILLEQFTALQQFLDYDHSNESRAAAMRDAVTYIAKSNKKALPVLTPIAKAKKQWQEVADWNRQHMTFDRSYHKYTVDGETNKYSVSELANILLYGEKSEANGNMVASGTVGTTVDDLLRALLDNTFREEDYNHLSPDLINQAKQIAKDIRKELNNTFKNGYHIITDEAALMTCGYVNDPFTGEKVLIAGTMDMVVIDNKGVSHLYDFKTHKSNYDKEIKDTDKYKTLTQYALQTYFYKTMNNVNSVNNITDNKLLQVNYTLQVPAELKSLTDITGSVQGDKIVFTYKNISDKTITQTINVPTDLKFYKTVEGLPSFEYEVQPITNSIKSQYILASINPSQISVRRTKAITTQASKFNITIVTKYKKLDPQQNTNTAMVFTENAQAYVTANQQDDSWIEDGYNKGKDVKLNVSDVNGTNQAGIRTDHNGNISQNAYGIVVKKYQQKKNQKAFLKKEGQFKDTKSDFEIFTRLNTDMFDRLSNSGLTNITFPSQIARGKAALPKRFAEWLQKELEDRFGLNVELKENNREGYEGYGLSIKSSNFLNQQQSESTTAQETSTEEYTQEMKDIKSDAIANDTFMKAPNGQPTKLNERQWLQVRTKAFKEWFGDWINDSENASKVIDDDGENATFEPLVVYHSSPNKFKKFRNTVHGQFFTDNENHSKSFGQNRYAVFLNIRNPYIIENRELGASAVQYEFEDNKNIDGVLGYSIINYRTKEQVNEFVTRNSIQIKSATDNSGKFSTTNDDIYDTITVQSLQTEASKEDINVVPLPYIVEKSNINSRNSNYNGEYIIRVDKEAMQRFNEYIKDMRNAEKKDYIKQRMQHILVTLPIGCKIRVQDVENVDDLNMLKNFLKSDGIIADYSDIQEIDLTDEKNLLEEAKKLDLLTEVTNLSTADEHIYSNILRVPSFTYGKTAETIERSKSKEELINTVGARKVRTLASSAMFALSDLVTQIQEGDARLVDYIENEFFQIGDKSPEEIQDIVDELKGKDRLEIIQTITLDNLEDAIKRMYFTIDDEYGLDEDFIEETEVIHDNWKAFLEYGRVTLAELEQLPIDGNGQVVNQMELVLFGEEDEQTIQSRYGSSLEQWQVGFRSVSTFMSMGQLIKQALGTMKVLDEDNDVVANAWGIAERLDAGVITGKILSWVKECSTAEEMVKVLQQKVADPNNADERWLLQLVNDDPELTNSDGELVGIGRLITEDLQGNRHSDNENFRSQFFTTMRKYFQKYGIVFQKGKTTNIKMLNESEGIDPLLDEILAKIRTGNIPLFENGKLTEDTILNLSKLIGEVDASTNVQNKVAQKVLDILETVGIDHFDIEHAKLMLLNPKLRGAFIKQANYLVSKIQEVFEKVEETQRKNKTINLQDAVAEKTRSDIKKILNIFHDFIKMGYEAVFYQDGKLYYSYVMPSYISRFNQDIRNKDDFMKDTFSEVDFFATKIGNKTVYFNKWIERLATDKNVRQNVFDHKVQLSDRGKNYRKKTAAEYSSSMLREFYYDVNNIFAWYRIPMMSNKPSEEYIKFYRVKNNFRKTISEWLVDTTFQEVLRISDVVARAVSRLNGTMLEEECTENYDLDLTDFAKKDEDGNPVIIDGKIQIADNKKYLLEEENIVTLKQELLKLGANGAKFVMLDFLEDYLLDYLDGVDSTVGKYLHDKILAEDKKFDGTSEAEQIDELRNTIIREIEAQIDENGEIARDDNGNVLRSSDSKFQEYINFLQSEGYIKVDDKGKWSTRDSDILGKDNETIKERLAEFFWNDLYASISIMQLYIGDPAYYKNAEDLQKRLAQLHAPGSALNTTARDSNGELYSKDGIYRGITLQDEEIISDTIDNLNEVYDELMEQNENNPAMRAYLTTQKNNIIKALSEVNATDAQTFCTPTGMRKRLGMLGQWGNDREEAYEKILKGEITQSNLNILMQPTKPFIYTQINKPSYHGTMNTRRFGVQVKTSEYMLIIADAIIKGAGRTNTKLAAVFDAIEESMGTWNKDKTKFTPNGRGIDAISFNSSIKTGLGAVIDLNGNLTYQEIKERLKNAIYAEGNSISNPSADDTQYNSNYVYELNYSDYNIQQAVPTHFFDKQQIGSQTKALGFADVDEYVRDSAGNIMLDEDGNKIEATIKVKNSDGELETITVSEAKKEFYQKLADNIEISKQRLIKEFKLTNVDKRIQNIAISELLQKQMLRDSRFGADLLWAVDTDENGEFNIPLSDPTHSERIQQLLYSIIKSRIYKQEIHGGPVVQVANWGTGEDLHIRFTNKDGDTILTEEEFNVRKEEFKEKGHARNIVYPFDHASIVDENGELFSSYKQYKEYHKDGGVYYECYAPIFDEGLLKQYEKNGVIDINKIHAEQPELLELIGYRIPTEAKYSMASLRIVGFLPREAGEGLMLPKEWTAISGSDYDIDKLYIMRRSYEFQEAPESIQSDKYKGTFVKGNTKTDRNNDRIFDILQGVLEAHQNITKVLKNGNFDTLKEEAYKIEAYKASDRSLEELDKMNSKKLKNLAMQDKNLIYNHIHTQFFKQNMVAADLIGVFAQSNVSHAYLSMYAIHTGMDEGLPLRGVEFNSFSLFGNVITNDTLHIDAPFGFDGTPISDNIAQFLAASVDAVKDPILNLVNINMQTVNIAMAMARMGFSIKQICLFLGQDIVKDIITDMNSTKEYLDDALLKKKIELQANVNKIANGNIRINNDISEENLRDNIKNRSAQTDLAIVQILSEMSKIADAFRPIINMTRFNSISASKGPSIIESFIDDLKVFDFNNRIAKNNPEIAEAVNNPMLKQLRESQDSLEQQLMESRFVLYGSEFARHFLFWLANMGYDIYTIPKKEIKNFGRFYMDFAVNSVSPLFNFDRDNRLKVVSTYPAKIAKLKKTKGLRQNKFIQNLTARFDYKDQYLSIDVDVRGKGDSYVEQIREDFTEFAKKHPKYTANIIEYMFNRGGFGYSPKTFTNLITNYIKTNLMSEYISNLRELENGAPVLNTLVCQFILNTVPVKKMPKVSYVDYSIEDTTKSFVEMNVGDTFTLVDEDPLNEDSINGYGVYMLDLDGNSRIVQVLDIIGTNRADKLVLQIVEPLGGNGQGIELNPNNTFVKSIYRETEESSDEESVENDENELPDGDSKVSGEEKQQNEVDNLNDRISTDKYSPKTMTKVTTVSKFSGVSINEIVDVLKNRNYCGT